MKITDQIGRQIDVAETPKRIISLVPSQSELLYDLGLTEEVVGITKFCVHPKEWFESKTRIGGTKNPDLDKIRSLNPDLIIANKEENMEEHVLELAKDFPVYVSDVKDLPSACEMINRVGEMLGKAENGKDIVEKINAGFAGISKKESMRAAYLIWRNPYMTVGGDTFINHLLEACGLENVFANQKRYPQTLLEEIKSLKPDVLFLSTEPYPFQEEHKEEMQRFLPDIKIKFIDGEMFSWYGSRLLKTPEYWNNFEI